MSEALFLTRSRFAAHIGCAKSYVTKLGEQGRLVLNDAGLIDVERTKSLIAGTTGAPERGKITTRSFADAKDKREAYSAEMARLDLEERVGKLLVAEDVVKAVASAAAFLRTRLEQLPASLAPQLAATRDETHLQALLASEIEAVLGELSHQFGRIASQPGRSA